MQKKTAGPGGVKPPNFQEQTFLVTGTAPLVVNKFSAKAREMIKEKQEAGSQAKKGEPRQAKDFEECFEGARHVSEEGWDGIPCASFRGAMIDACRVVGFTMTLAKQVLFVMADGLDADEGTPLVRIEGDTPEMTVMPTRNETGVVDLRARPMWRRWSALLTVRYHADFFTADDVHNLLQSAGISCGVCEGRPNSKKSAGMGWGTFSVERA